MKILDYSAPWTFVSAEGNNLRQNVNTVLNAFLHTALKLSLCIFHVLITPHFCHIPSFQCSQEICVCNRKAPVFENRERPDSVPHAAVKIGKTGGHLRVHTHYNDRRDSKGRQHHIRRGSSGVSFSSQKVTFLLREWGIQNVTSMSPCKYLISCRICWGCLTPR